MLNPSASFRTELTPREIEVLQLAANGYSAKDIGAALHLSAETIKTHLRHIYLVLSARNRTHAVAIALREGMID